jgi:two-component system LytT family response regulator
MTKMLIVDDEPMARLRIRKLAEKCADIVAIEEACDGVDALAKISMFAPDVVYLDIDMPEMTGFEVLENLETVPFAVVFQTAYSQFAIKAFEVNACDYLLKPFSDERWNDSFERAKRNVTSRGAQLEGLKDHLHQNGLFLNRFLIRSGARNHLLKAEEVTHFSSEEHMTYVHTSERSYGYDQSLSFLEQKLDPKTFLRVHRNAIINLNFLKTFTSGADGVAVLQNGTEVNVSREKRRRLREVLGSSEE